MTELKRPHLIPGPPHVREFETDQYRTSPTLFAREKALLIVLEDRDRDRYRGQ